MTYGLAVLAFLIAAIIAILGVHGISLTVIIGIIAIGLTFLALAEAGFGSGWGAGNWNARRRVP